MKRLNIFILSTMMLASCFSLTGYGQENPDPISAVLNATGSAVKELQDELAKRPTSTHFVATDYKEWNLKFRKKLDYATSAYAEQIATEIVLPLKPLSDRYRAIMTDPAIRDDQRSLL